MSESISPTPFVVTKVESQVYYKGLLLQPPLIATTISGPIKVPTGMEGYLILKELRCLNNHLLASSWDSGLAYQLCHALNTMSVDWTSLDLVHIPKVEESSTDRLVIV